MKFLFCLALTLLAACGRLPNNGHQHWCDQPTHKLHWLIRMIQDAQAWPAHHYGWEVHQARYRGQEVFVLNLCRYCGRQQGFLIYNHQGALIGQGEGADSVRLSNLTNDRLLAEHPGLFRMQRKASLLRTNPINYGGPTAAGVIPTEKDDKSLFEAINR